MILTPSDYSGRTYISGQKRFGGSTIIELTKRSRRFSNVRMRRMKGKGMVNLADHYYDEPFAKVPQDAFSDDQA
jgi:predicted patatin/cPLA2 family phospholipase